MKRGLWSFKHCLYVVTVFAGALCQASVASACCSIASGTVTRISALPGGVFFFSLAGTEDRKPACNTSDRFAISTNEKAIVAVVLSAYLSGRPVTVVGLQTCTTWGDSEDVGSVNSP